MSPPLTCCHPKTSFHSVAGGCVRTCMHACGRACMRAWACRWVCVCVCDSLLCCQCVCGGGVSVYVVMTHHRNVCVVGGCTRVCMSVHVWFLRECTCACVCEFDTSLCFVCVRAYAHVSVFRFF